MAARASVPAVVTLISDDARRDLEDTRSEARRRADQIRALAGNVADDLARLRELVHEAKAAEDHVELGYASWTAYLADMFGTEPLRLAREVRQELVAELAAQGMSTRAIAPIVGVSKSQVATDIEVSSSGQQAEAVPVDAPPADVAPDEPVKVAGLDGKSYTRPAPRATPAPDPATDIERTVAEIERVAARSADLAVTGLPAERAVEWSRRLSVAVTTLRGFAHLIEGQS